MDIEPESDDFFSEYDWNALHLLGETEEGQEWLESFFGDLDEDE